MKTLKDKQVKGVLGNYYKDSDVKKAVVEFDIYLFNIRYNKKANLDEVYEKYYEIFGEFNG